VFLSGSQGHPTEQLQLFSMIFHGLQERRVAKQAFRVALEGLSERTLHLTSHPAALRKTTKM
jgi:hypothetical protein